MITRVVLPESVVGRMSGASARDNTRQNTTNRRLQIKISDPAGNRTRDDGLEGRESTDHAMATDARRINKKISIMYG